MPQIKQTILYCACKWVKPGTTSDFHPFIICQFSGKPCCSCCSTWPELAGFQWLTSRPRKDISPQKIANPLGFRNFSHIYLPQSVQGLETFFFFGCFNNAANIFQLNWKMIDWLTFQWQTCVVSGRVPFALPSIGAVESSPGHGERAPTTFAIHGWGAATPGVKASTTGRGVRKRRFGNGK